LTTQELWNIVPFNSWRVWLLQRIIPSPILHLKVIPILLEAGKTAFPDVSYSNIWDALERKEVIEFIDGRVLNGFFWELRYITRCGFIDLSPLNTLPDDISGKVILKHFPMCPI